jgi:hypothetical protein
MDLDELVGSLTATGEIPHIPMDIAVPFFLVAVRWVREHGPEIAAELEKAERDRSGNVTVTLDLLLITGSLRAHNASIIERQFCNRHAGMEAAHCGPRRWG